ncbi:uroporphyrinogen-III synthase [Microbacterium esteraromaticum]|uniref:uroporphyrinogen-III synthase n=1 Tax=Microbacterium esteraromaticum TaxID=57043 RepID=UPI000C077964|nr:uroporphyrinogen-III synthase [Microbacterium esteraromaticum]
MTASETKTARPLDGWRVLVPRGGPWGDGVAASLRAMGAVPVVAPLINFAPTTDQDALDAALERLQAGEYDWLTITSATTVDVLYAHRVEIPSKTKVAAVGETTAAALHAVGYDVALMPELDNSAAGMAEKIISIEPDAQRILTLRSEIAKPVLSVMLTEAGHDVDSVVAYRTVGVPVTDRIRRDVENGRINAILITSGSVAKQVREQFPEIPDTTMLAAIGPRTARDAEKVGLPVTAIADKQTVDALIDTVSRFTLPHAADEFAP